MGIIGALVFTMQLSRFCPPIGEKHLFLIEPGGYDLAYPVDGARELLDGASPYVAEHQYYPPTYYWLFVPLVYFFSTSGIALFMYWFNLACFGLLAAITSRLLARIAAPEDRGLPAYFFLLVSLAMSFTGYFALERGQADVFLALCCWAGVLAMLQDRGFTALFLIAIPSFAKGYTSILWVGIACLLWTRPDGRKQVMLGGAVPFVLFLLPVMHWLPIAFERNRARMNLVSKDFSNTGLSNLLLVAGGDDALRFKTILMGLAVFSIVATFFMVCHAYNKGTHASRAIWLVAFAASSNTLMTSASSLSFCYNLLFFLPALLAWALGQGGLVSELGLGKRGSLALGLGIGVTVFAVFRYVVPGFKEFPLAAIGVLTAQVCFGGAALSQLVRSWVSARERTVPSLNLVTSSDPALTSEADRTTTPVAS